MGKLISVQDLWVSFRLSKTHTVQAVKGVSFDIPVNATVALVGESGSGKSVSSMSIVRLLPENAIVDARSKVLYQGRDLLNVPIEDMRPLRGKDISVVFQEPMSSLNPVFTVGEQIAVVLRSGEVRETGPVARIFNAPADAYTQALLACRPRLDARPRRLAR